jgi:Ca2+-binding RTX toxin-like protein
MNMTDIQLRYVTAGDYNDPRYIVEPGEIVNGINLDGVGAISNIYSNLINASGTLLPTGRHILTAGHVVTEQIASNTKITFNLPTGDVTMYAKQFYLHPNYQPDPNLQNDIAIIELTQTAPTNIPRYDIYRLTDEMGKKHLKVGYGFTGTGNTGGIIVDDRRKRVGYNTYEDDGRLLSRNYPYYPNPIGSQLVYDFDNGQVANDALGKLIGKNNLGLGLDEVNSAIGDSGGPVFIAGKIAGFTSWGVGGNVGISTDIDNTTNSSFGEISVDTRVSYYTDWIERTLNKKVGNAANNTMKGTSQSDNLIGLDGNDTLIGYAGKDSLVGGNHNDCLNGGIGDDTLLGGSGGDRLLGGAGNDYLTGNTGTDQFIFNSGRTFARSDLGVDRITDFSVTDGDKIILNRRTFTTISSQAGTGFSVLGEFRRVTSDTAARNSSADIIYNVNNGKLFYNPDGATVGFGSGGVFAILTNLPNLQANNFLLV